MVRRLLILFIAFSLSWTTVACGSAPQAKESSKNTGAVQEVSTPSLIDGRYPVQQATYDDADGEYTLMLLNTPPGQPPILRTRDLQMARLSDEEVAAGEKTFLEVANAQSIMHLTEDFRIEYVHNVTESQVNAQTGQPETVVVRRESGFWSPFAGALAGQALGSLLFTPHYYVPPLYQSGGVMTGYGGYGRSYGQAVDQYATRYQAPPAAEKNRQMLRTAGRVRQSASGKSASGQSTASRSQPTTSSRGTGSGVGSSTLKGSSSKSGYTKAPARSPSFGSRGMRSGGGRRR